MAVQSPGERHGAAVTYLVVSHRRSALERADQVVTLEDGRAAGESSESSGSSG